MNQTDLTTLFEVFGDSCDNSIDKNTFDRCIRTLVRGEDFNADEASSLSVALSNIYFAYDTNHDNVVDTIDVTFNIIFIIYSQIFSCSVV